MKLAALLGDYPVTRALKAGEVRSPRVALEFAAVATPSSAFKRVVRELAFDVSELAIMTFLAARAHGKPLVLLPAVVLARYQHPYLVYNAARGALAAGAPIFCDSEMVAHGITRARLPAHNDVICTLNDGRVPDLAGKLAKLPGLAAGALKGELANAFAQILDINVVDVLCGGWSKLKELQSYRDQAQHHGKR